MVSVLTPLFVIAGWSYLPNFATRQLLPIFHKIYQRYLHRTPPAPHTSLYSLHYRFVYAFVVLSYLLYTFYNAALSMEPNYYEILGVDPVADNVTLKMAFRQFARKYHPDRVGPQGETAFINVRDAFEALKNPVTRFAYDRFGPDALQWTQCTTLREYVRHGLMQSAGFHVFSICVLLLFSAVGKPSPVSFWRFILFFALLVYELVFVLGPSPSPSSNSSLSSFLFFDPASPSSTSILGLLWRRRVAYQHIRFLHSLFVLCSVGLSRVAPVLFPSEDLDMKQLQAEIDRIALLAKTINLEVSSQIQTELHSVHGPQTNTAPTDANALYTPPLPKPTDEVMALLTSEMEKMVIETQLQRDGGPLKSAIDVAVRRRRAELHAPNSVTMGMLSPSPSPHPSRVTEKIVRRGSPAMVGAHAAPRTFSAPGYVRARSKSY
ncbi:Chaperone protein DnaJ [Grifola frondosa]|uniref:Chaperone protein DnaJ n=1 Tax=Grifola frondosa TaxID=5627 RepID=A0A1C7LYZ7_GRIFR|nr:Chaperone protein DnaJ [Grifola frondosa]